MIKTKLSRILGDKRITQAELAEMTDLRANTISDLYNENTEGIRFETLDKICKVLACSVGDVLEFVNEETNGVGVEEGGSIQKQALKTQE